MRGNPWAYTETEIDWLLSFGVHPYRICEQLNRSPHSLKRTAERHRRPDLAHLFHAEDQEWRKKHADTEGAKADARRI